MEVAVIATLASGAVAFLAWFAHSWRSNARRTRRVLRRTRVTPIAKLVDGTLACVVGRVEVEGDEVTSLMTRRSCVAYETIVQVFGGIDMTVPSRVDVTRRVVPFFVTDDTGRVRVDAAQAALANDPSARSERFEERVIENGARVRIVGSVVLDPARSATGDHGFREGDWTATLTGTRKYPLLVDVEPE
jgi:hypothetical protein